MNNTKDINELLQENLRKVGIWSQIRNGHVYAQITDSELHGTQYSRSLIDAAVLDKFKIIERDCMKAREATQHGHVMHVAPDSIRHTFDRPDGDNSNDKPPVSETKSATITTRDQASDTCRQLVAQGKDFTVDRGSNNEGPWEFEVSEVNTNPTEIDMEIPR